jgi:hypothetical protein
MPRDYGVRTRPRSLRGVWFGLLPALAAVALVLGWNSLLHRKQELAEGWVGDRPECPQLSAAAYAAKGYRRGERLTAYENVIFARQFGHVECKDIDTRGGLGVLTHPVCQFTGPAALRVQAGAGEAFFEPGVGQIATVSIERGRAQCALGGKFTPLAGPS